MHGADNLNVALRDAVHPDSPSGIVHGAVRHALKKLNGTTAITEEARAYIKELVD